MDAESLKRENDTYKEEIKNLLEKIKRLEMENKKYKQNYGGCLLPVGFSGYNS